MKSIYNPLTRLSDSNVCVFGLLQTHYSEYHHMPTVWNICILYVINLCIQLKMEDVLFKSPTLWPQSSLSHWMHIKWPLKNCFVKWDQQVKLKDF